MVLVGMHSVVHARLGILKAPFSMPTFPEISALLMVSSADLGEFLAATFLIFVARVASRWRMALHL